MIRAGNERLSNKKIVLPVAANAVIQEASMVALNSEGYAIEAIKNTGLKIAGCSMSYIDNGTGTAGEQMIPVRRGAFVWENDGTIKVTDCLKECFVKDSKTVSITAEGSSKAGIIIEVSDDGITVDMI